MSGFKKIKYLLVTFVFVFILSIPNAYAKHLKIVTSFTILEDIAKNIVGNKATVTSLTKPGEEIHTYQPTPRALTQIANADLLLVNGLDLEQWIQRVYQNNIAADRVIVVSKGVKPILIEDGAYKGRPNPHGWMSLVNAEIYTKNITDAVVKADPENAAYYRTNEAIYISKIHKIKDETLKILAPLKGKWLITSEESFTYVAKDLGLNTHGIWPVNSHDTGTPQQIKDTIDIIKKYGVKVVFSGSTMDIKPMEAVMKATGAKFGGIIYIDTISDKDGPVPTYLDMLKKTSYTIRDGFAKYQH